VLFYYLNADDCVSQSSAIVVLEDDRGVHASAVALVSQIPAAVGYRAVREWEHRSVPLPAHPSEWAVEVVPADLRYRHKSSMQVLRCSIGVDHANRWSEVSPRKSYFPESPKMANQTHI
jgi:hypothetical protein